MYFIKVSCITFRVILVLQERSRLQTELDDYRRRLNKAERDLVNSKEECIHLTTNSQALEREVLLFQCVSITHGVQHYI